MISKSCLRLPAEGPCECDLYLTCAKFLTTPEYVPRLRARWRSNSSGGSGRHAEVHSADKGGTGQATEFRAEKAAHVGGDSCPAPGRRRAGVPVAYSAASYYFCRT